MMTHQNTEKKTAEITSADIKLYGVHTISESKSKVLFKTVQIINISTPIVSDETVIRQQYTQEEYLETQFKKLQGSNKTEPSQKIEKLSTYTPGCEFPPFGTNYDSDTEDNNEYNNKIFKVHVVSLSGPKYEWKEQWYKIDIDKMFCSQMWMRYIKLREDQFEYLTADHLRNEYFDQNIDYLQELLENIADVRCYEDYYYHIKQKEYDDEKEFEKYGSMSEDDISDTESNTNFNYESDDSCDSID